mgnify:FL=1
MTIYKVTCVLDQFDDEILYDKLFEIGAISIDISDYKNDSILDNTNVILSEISEKWENNRLEILFNCQSQNNFELILEKLKKIDNFNLKIENTSKVNEEDWVKRSKDSFKKIQFTNALEVYPSWEKMDKSFRYNIQIDPGQAFGTGSHQTTKLCIEWLLQNEKKKFSNVIDYGCGSGLLAIIAKTLYKTKVLGVDIDSKAIDVATKNSIANNLDIKFSHVDKVKYETYDLIIANILLNVLTTLKPIFLKILKKQGVIIFTGILENQVKTLIEEYEESFQKVKIFRKDNWALVEMCF